MATGQGVGARLIRKEDDRLMRGRGQFVADLRFAGMQDVAFVRSPLAHARIRGIAAPQSLRHAVFTAPDLVGVKPIRAVSGLRGFKVSEQPALATDKVRFVGELVAMCLAPTRAQAEDIAGSVTLDLEELPAVHDMLAARTPGSELVHDHWADNVFLETFVDVDIGKALDAPIKVTREIRTARQCMAPIEGRGVVALWDTRLEQLTLYSACQMPHIVRTGLAGCLGLEEAQVRIIAPDVGGGFGYKGILLAEEVCLGWLAMHCGHPVRWIEDRREHLTAGANCREHYYRITGYADRDGRLIGIDCEATVDSGAYSSYPFSACLEAAQVASILPGPYDFPAFRCRTYSVATNKCPILPYRGVARTGVCFALELLLDAIAREAGVEPHEVRAKILVRPEQMPFDNITNKHFDSGDYPQSLRRALAAIDIDAVRVRQHRGEPDGRLIGVGLSIYCEQAAHGTSVYYGWGIPMVPGYEQATARVTPDGGLELRVGVHSHGQGLETTLAQVAHEILGIDVARIRVVHGDTAMTPYSTGTWGSRCMVMAGGAVSTACKEIARRAIKVGAQLLQANAESVSVRGGEVVGPQGSISLGEIARTWYLKPAESSQRRRSGGLEATIDTTSRYETPVHSATPLTPHWSPGRSEISDVEIDWRTSRTGAGHPMMWTVKSAVVLRKDRTVAREEMPFDPRDNRWPDIRRLPCRAPRRCRRRQLDHRTPPRTRSSASKHRRGRHNARRRPSSYSERCFADEWLGAHSRSPTTYLDGCARAGERRRTRRFDYAQSEQPSRSAPARTSWSFGGGIARSMLNCGWYSPTCAAWTSPKLPSSRIEVGPDGITIQAVPMPISRTAGPGVTRGACARSPQALPTARCATRNITGASSMPIFGDWLWSRRLASVIARGVRATGEFRQTFGLACSRSLSRPGQVVAIHVLRLSHVARWAAIQSAERPANCPCDRCVRTRSTSARSAADEHRREADRSDGFGGTVHPTTGAAAHRSTVRKTRGAARPTTTNSASRCPASGD
jgi:carbon-monoxide dehydrogenase large subunit